MPLFLPLALALSAAASPAQAPAAVRAALARALAVPGARLEVAGYAPALPPRCAASEAEALRPIVASGRAPLRLVGPSGCEGYGFAQVRVYGPALVASRALGAGEPLAPAVSPSETELRPGHGTLSTLPPGAVAAHAIAAGAAIGPDAVRAGPRPGDPVAVELRIGDIAVRVTGRALPCARDRACALLPSGRRVEGRLLGDRIAVEAP